MKVYRSSSKDCGPCPLRGVCIGKSDFKKIDDSIDKPYYDRMHARLQTVNGKKIRQLRSSTVEPVLGTLVNYLAMRRVNTRGIKQARKIFVFLFFALCPLIRRHNIKTQKKIRKISREDLPPHLNCHFFNRQL